LGFVDYYNVQQRHKSVVLALADQQKDEQQSNNSSNDDNNKEKAQVASEETKQNIPSNREETPNQPENKNNTTTPVKETPEDNLPPIFKIQIYTSSRSLREGSGQFKGLTKVDHYMDKNIYKYTYGSTASYSEITTLKKTIIEKFPDCFIVAFRGNNKISIQDALSIQKKMFANH
jgi:N-acetylmuramoyl-L-alanine amidase